MFRPNPPDDTPRDPSPERQATTPTPVSRQSFPFRSFIEHHEFLSASSALTSKATNDPQPNTPYATERTIAGHAGFVLRSGDSTPSSISHLFSSSTRPAMGSSRLMSPPSTSPFDPASMPCESVMGDTPTPSHFGSQTSLNPSEPMDKMTTDEAFNRLQGFTQPIVGFGMPRRGAQQFGPVGQHPTRDDLRPMGARSPNDPFETGHFYRHLPAVSAQQTIVGGLRSPFISHTPRPSSALGDPVTHDIYQQGSSTLRTPHVRSVSSPPHQTAAEMNFAAFRRRDAPRPAVGTALLRQPRGPPASLPLRTTATAAARTASAALTAATATHPASLSPVRTFRPMTAILQTQGQAGVPAPGADNDAETPASTVITANGPTDSDELASHAQDLARNHIRKILARLPEHVRARAFPGFSPWYQGDITNPANQSADVAHEHNTSLWITGLPASVTVRELLAAIRGYGRIHACVVNPPRAELGHRHAAAKVVFFENAPAQRFHADANDPARAGLVVRGARARVCHNRIRSAEAPHSPRASRVLLVLGAREFVNEASLTAYFRTKFQFQVDEVITIECSSVANLVEYRFGSFRCQAEIARMALAREKKDVAWSVEFGEDPCAAPGGMMGDGGNWRGRQDEYEQAEHDQVDGEDEGESSGWY